ncbi:MAG: Gfo/Idh/MocA family oxidoreductase [Aigarchaeota archaeon]|nr:Gfo/Idh/MocA family oxidoreductase [Aigarchaeota archaeon]MCX8193235.1 Gfo/Idh/MocA family oxidoreductase [Nitrososphaeria archaeon]MDW7986376.1 Gfo/Idh/MocA family oxidoreductase [Nitrososphaerota archaeon]
MVRRVKVCVIGAGRAGEVHALNLVKRITIAELVAIVDTDLALAKQLSEKVGGVNCYRTLSEALKNKEIEAVFITTPTFTHSQLTIEAAEAGVHVFCEKPMALSLEEADKMISVAKKNNVKLQIGFMRRFDPEIRKVKSLIVDGVIGRPVLVKSLTRGPGLPPRWALDPKTGIGMIAEVSSHDFDSVRWLMGSEPKTVYSEADALINPDFKKEYETYHDVYVSIIRFENNGIGVVDGGCPVGYGYDARLEILGTEGLIIVGDVKGGSLMLCKSDKKAVTETFPSWRNRFSEGYIGEAESFLRAIIEDKNPEVTGEDGRKALEIVLAALESMRTNRPVTLPLR